MALYHQSQTPFVTAVQRIADSVGASADTEMTTRAWHSLNSAIRHFNTRHKWNWLWTEANPIQVVAPFTVGVTASAGQVSAVVSGTTFAQGILADDIVIGRGFAPGTRVTAIEASGFGIGPVGITGIVGSATAEVTVLRDSYNLPDSYRNAYSVRLLRANKVLAPLNRRANDRITTTDFASSQPDFYDTFLVGSKGKIRLVDPPAENDILLIRYHRQMATASASAVTANLDIPDDYEPYLVAWAKWHFLTDKDQQGRDQGVIWHSLANDGLQIMLRDQTNQPDESLGFSPGHASNSYDTTRNTRSVDWHYTRDG